MFKHSFPASPLPPSLLALSLRKGMKESSREKVLLLLMSARSSKLTNLEPCQEPSLWPHPLTTVKTQAFIYPFGQAISDWFGVYPVNPGKSHYMSNKPFHTVFVHVGCPQSPYQNQLWFYRNSALALHRQ